MRVSNGREGWGEVGGGRIFLWVVEPSMFQKLSVEPLGHRAIDDPEKFFRKYGNLNESCV